MNESIVTQTHFRLPRNTRAVGSFPRGGHRSGWPYVISVLGTHEQTGGILLDDFVERTFSPARRTPTLWEQFFPTTHTPPVWKEPWVGIFHHPHNMPPWLNPLQHPGKVLATKRFQKSRPYLKGAIALSGYLARWLRESLDIPVVALKHPTEFPVTTFTWEAFMDNPAKKLVQVGWYLRNYRAIYQVEVPAELQKVHLAQDKPFILEAQALIDQHSPYRDRPDVGEVEVVPWIDHDAYDRLFTENIIFLELFDASANNTIVEAIVRETPIVVNRHPAVEEYLGEAYPLFYEYLEDVPSLLTWPTIKKAHDYLHGLNKHHLHIEHFLNEIHRFISLVND